MLLARDLPNLKRLFDDDEGLALLRQTLRVVQGHPKLLELADSLAADRADVLDAFFAVGGPLEGETRQADLDYVPAPHDWTAGLAGRLSSMANLLFAFLCRLEPEDRRQDIVEANFLNRLAATAKTALAEPEHGLEAALASLQAAGLVAVARPELDPAQIAGLQELLAKLAAEGAPAQALDPAALPGLLAAFQAQATTYTIHPGVAETARATAAPAVLDAADIELGNYHITMYQQGLETELVGGGRTVAESGRRAVPAAQGALGGGVHPAGTDAPARQEPGCPGLRPAAAAPHRRGHCRHRAGADRRRRPGQDAVEGQPHRQGGGNRS